jgi:ribosomal-protein-alanine N-acetyltransferase
MSQPHPAFAIVPMADHDIDEVMEMAAGQPHAPSWTRAAYEVAVDAKTWPKRVALVTKSAQNDHIAGFIIASVNAPDSELETIVTAASHQRQGIARKLFAALLNELRGAGATQITLEVRPSNHPAIALYKSLGFHQSGTRPRYYADPVEDAVLMHFGFS